MRTHGVSLCAGVVVRVVRVRGSCVGYLALVFAVGEGVHAGEEEEHVAADLAHAPGPTQLGELRLRPSQKPKLLLPPPARALVGRLLLLLLGVGAPQESSVVVEAQPHIVHRLRLASHGSSLVTTRAHTNAPARAQHITRT